MKLDVADLGDVRQLRAGQQQQGRREGERGRPLAPVGKDHQRVGHLVEEEAAANEGKTEVTSSNAVLTKTNRK